MKQSDIADLRKEFEQFTQENCSTESCESEDGVDLKDYPSYTEVLYAKLIAPSVSGVYISRWDIKDIALVAGDSMAIHPRKRMFELLMKYATSKENMQAVLDALEIHMQDKVNIYEEFIISYPSSVEIFQPKIDKAKKTMNLFPQIIKEYFL